MKLIRVYLSRWNAYCQITGRSTICLTGIAPALPVSRLLPGGDGAVSTPQRCRRSAQPGYIASSAWKWLPLGVRRDAIFRGGG